MHVETSPLESLEPISRTLPTRNSSEMELECLFQNLDQKNLVAPLRKAHAALAQSGRSRKKTVQQCRSALALQEQWNAWLAQRDQLRNEIKRGRECLEQTRKDLAAVHGGLEDWTGYERICGKNPLCDYMQTLAAKERVEQFLPDWLKRREEQLKVISRKLEHCAKQNGLEHLL